ncbi:MAG TPA: response regulator [Acidocella sp.]|jgi:DNA-binding response OmpR family regulator/DNA-binding CsgD family transcriptional regulator|nr:response regulator [Acidocella sp.]
MPRPKILIIDDQPAMLNLLIEAFEPAGFDVLVALQGEMALLLLNQVIPDVILLDAMMPGIDGFETCRRLKLRPALALVPVIFMTGLSETADIVQGLQAGGVDYVTKPVAPVEVIARVQVHLANARLTRSAQQAMDATGRYLLAADDEGRVRWCTTQAARLLGALASSEHLPPEIVAWLKAHVAGIRPVPETIIAGLGEAAQGARVEVSLVGALGPDEHLLRLVALNEDHDLDRLHTRMKLTRREAEVLLWLARGKSNRDIGEILDVSHRTVNKHLEQIYPKLGVEGRTAAVALAVRALGDR